MAQVKGQTDQVNIQKTLIAFSSFYRQCEESESLYLLVGPKKAGKSVAIDLMTDKVISQVQNQEGHQIMVKESNLDCRYDEFYVQQLQNKGNKTAFLEGFTLNTQLVSSVINRLKSLFVKEGGRKAKKLSIVIVLDSAQMKKLKDLVEHLLNCLQLLDQSINHIAQNIANHCFILLTKSEEDNPYQEFEQTCGELVEEAQNQGIKVILEHLMQGENIKVFPNAPVQQKLGQTIREAFVPKPVKKIISQFFAKAIEDQSVLGSTQEEQTLGLLDKFANIILNLTKVIGKNEKPGDYQDAIKQLFQDQKMPNLAISNMGNRSWKPKTMAERTILELNKQKQSRHLLKAVLDALGQISETMLQTASNKSGYLQLKGISSFFRWIFPWIREDAVQKQIQKIASTVKECLTIMSQIQREQSEQVGVKKSSLEKKNKKQTAFTTFKTKLQECKDNRDAITTCIKVVKAKEKEPNYDCNEVIYYIKMLRDLLYDFDFKYNKGNSSLFVDQLLELYLYNQNFYEFERVLDLYIGKNALSVETAQRLLKPLDKLSKFDSQIKLIDYLIANSWKDEDFILLNKIKRKVLYKSHQEHCQRADEELKQPQISRKMLELSLTPDLIGDKLKNKEIQGTERAALESYLSSKQQFWKYIGKSFV